MGIPVPPAGTGAASAARPGAPDPFQAVAEQFAGLVEGHVLDLPLPGSGRTAERFGALRALGRQDLSVARLAEGHVDAAAILDELDGCAANPGERWGVWAAHPPGPELHADNDGTGWRLRGVKQYCSGARICTHALVTAETGRGRRLFAVRLADRGVAPVPDSWQALGMVGSDTLDVTFHDVPAEPVGEVEGYVQRAGFQHGGVGVAACWLGGAQAVADTLLNAAAQHPLDGHAAAHLGQADALLHAAETVLDRAAREIDEDFLDRSSTGRVRSLRVRAFVEKVCTEVLQHVGRATGAGPLCRNAAHARAVADLTVYLRQHHAERSDAELGTLLARGEGAA
ncbi:acyl-CoA dehydrogenase [Streptomyces sp. NPDC001219]